MADRPSRSRLAQHVIPFIQTVWFDESPNTLKVVFDHTSAMTLLSKPPVTILTAFSNYEKVVLARKQNAIKYCFW